MALLIATDRYDDSGLRRLSAPAADVVALADVLGNPSIAGFEVSTLINEPHHRVGEAIGALYRYRRRDDLTLLYFSGHGLKDDSGRLFLAMTNTLRDNLLFAALSADQIDQAMESCVSQQKVLVLDCCYSGAFPAGWVAKADATVHDLQELGGRGRIVLTACDAVQYSFEGDQLHGLAVQSLFTRYLVAGLGDGSADRDGDGDITLDELYQYVYERVISKMPQQRPKKQDNVEGRIIIGQNINWTLPQQLRNLVSSPIAADRRVALDDLARRHGMGNDVVRGSVRDVIRELTDDDSKLVSAAATTLLQTGHLEPFMDAVQRPVHQISNGPAMSEPTAKRGREGPMASRPTPALPQRRVAVIRAHKKWGMTTHVMDVAFSPDGRLLASSGLDGVVRLWNPITHRPASRPLTSHNGLGWSPRTGLWGWSSNAVAFSPDGTLLASAVNDGTARLWNPTTGQPASPRSPTYMLAG